MSELRRISSDCDIPALLTIDLDRKCDAVLDQEVGLDLSAKALTPRGFCGQARPSTPPRGAASWGGTAARGCRRLPAPPSGNRRPAPPRGSPMRPKLIGELVDMRDGDVEAQPLDILGHARERPVRALRSASAAAPKLKARGIAQLPATCAASCTSRQRRCTNRPAPCTPSSVQITSRSGGESDSMNQRAVSAP